MDQAQKDYKDTLILPKTDFPMKGNLPQKEPDRYKKWQEYAYSTMSKARTSSTRTSLNKVKQSQTNQGEINPNEINPSGVNPNKANQNETNITNKNKSSTNNTFTLHDGPPYANGHLHVGHALNKILKDFITKYHYFQGRQVFYTPGWDCHGLPIEQQVSNAYEAEKKIPTKLEIREACRKHAEKFVEIQKNEFLSFGIVGDFDNPYKTMKYKFEADIYRALVKVAKAGLLTQRSKPIFWSWAAKSALAEAEVEYKDKRSDSIFVAFSLQTSTLKALNLESFSTKVTPYMLIWTTTPWTLPSNVAIALNPNESYVLVSNGAIVAKKLYEKLKERGIIEGEILTTIESKNFEKHYATNPLNNRDSMLILAEYVSMEDGSGAVHNAPGHGEDDYFTCLKYDLPVIMPVDDSGCFDESIITLGLFEKEVIDEFVGSHIFKAQKRILEILKDKNALLHHEEIVHSYPHCWRTNKPIIFRATKQWFILMDKPYYNGKTLRQVALQEIENTRFYPKNGINRIKSMVENRPDWCISRQRDWGVPIAFFIDKESGEPVIEEILTSHIESLFESHGCDVWWEREIIDLLPDSYKDKANLYEKNMHILDVWFDSGSTWFAVLDSKDYNSGYAPADVYLEGSDQHRGWFQSSLLLGCAINHKAPFKNIITHGFTIDEKSEKMSKSKGNVLAPSKIISESGSEILRLWVALSDYQNDVKISQNILKQVSENYLKLRNTIRFLLANTQGLTKLSSSENFSIIDEWVLHEAKQVLNEVDTLFSEYEFSKGFQVLNGFITATLSGIYLDICKDSLYCDMIDSNKRLAIQSVFAILANNILHLLAPFLTYTIDEALDYAPFVIKGEAKNVFELEKFAIPNFSFSEEKQEKIKLCLALRSLFNEQVDKLKKEKALKSSLELSLSLPKECENSKDLIADFLMVSECVCEKTNSDILFSINFDNKTYHVYKATKEKCPRCWQFKKDSNMEVCSRCNKVLS